MPTVFVCGKCGAASGIPNSSCARVMTIGRCGFDLGNYKKKEVTPTEYEELMSARKSWDLQTIAILTLVFLAVLIFVVI